MKRPAARHVPDYDSLVKSSDFNDRIWTSRDMKQLMNEAEIKREARLIAIERLACHTYNLVLKVLAVSEEEINGAERQSLEGLRMLPVAGMPPAISDVLSDEIVLDLARLLSEAHGLRAMAQD